MNPRLDHHVGSITNVLTLVIVACVFLLPRTDLEAAHNQSASSKPVASQVIPDPASNRDAPEVGRWKVNLHRSIFEPGPGPTQLQSATLAVSAGPAGHHFTIRRVSLDGKVFTEDFVLPIDGQDHDVPGSTRCGTLRARKLDSLIINFECKKDGKLLYTSVWVVSSDGSEMTVVKRGTTPDGRPSRNISTWERME